MSRSPPAQPSLGETIAIELTSDGLAAAGPCTRVHAWPSKRARNMPCGVALLRPAAQPSLSDVMLIESGCSLCPNACPAMVYVVQLPAW